MPLSPPPTSSLNNPSDSHFIALMIFLFQPFYCMAVSPLFLLSPFPLLYPLVPLLAYYPFPQPHHSSPGLNALSLLHCHGGHVLTLLKVCVFYRSLNFFKSHLTLKLYLKGKMNCTKIFKKILSVNADKSCHHFHAGGFHS